MIVQKGKQVSDLAKQYLNIKDIERTFSLLKPFIMKQWKTYLILLFLLFLDIAMTIAFAWFFGNIMDAAVQSDFEKLKELFLIGSFLVFTSIVSNYLDIYLETVAVNGVKKDLKNYLFNHILRLPTSTTSNMRSGELLSHFTNDVHNIDGVIGYSLLNLLRLPLIYVTVFVYLLHINTTLTMISILITPIALLAGILFGLLLRNNSRQIHKLYGKINSLLNETFLGFLVIRSFTLEKWTYQRFRKKNEELYELEIKNAKLQGWFSSGGQIVSSITFYTCLFLGAYYVFEDILTVGALITFINLVNYLVYPLTGLASQWAGFQRSVAAIERLLEVLEEPAFMKLLPSYSPQLQASKAIEFKDVYFTYNGTTKVFEHFDLSIPAGKKVAIVGPSGAGKSTLFNLLQSFYRPQSGELFLDGVSIEELTISQLRSSIAHVPQETFLFAGTIKENLMMARPDVTEEEMIQAAIHANIHNFVLSLPNDYDTEIGERGLKLSGGQKQRIAIARAILKDAPILLLDEATSALDSETESYIKDALDQLMKGRTTLIIAHRLSTVLSADMIIVLDQGKILQKGKHEELIHKEGMYQNLYRSQFGGEKKLSLVSN